MPNISMLGSLKHTEMKRHGPCFHGLSNLVKTFNITCEVESNMSFKIIERGGA